jgi:thiol-disulfide isomerase/thioredoxin
MLRQFLLLGICLGGLVGFNQHSASPHQAAKHVAAGEIGSSMPDFSVKDLRGHSLSSSDLRGKVVLIDFWATWCQPCKKEMPGYQNLADRYGRRGFVVIGFKFDTMPDMQDPLQFAKEIGAHYPLAAATDVIKQKFGGIQGLPTTMIFDRNGILRTKIIGFEYTKAIEAALGTLF